MGRNGQQPNNLSSSRLYAQAEVDEIKLKTWERADKVYKSTMNKQLCVCNCSQNEKCV